MAYILPLPVTTATVSSLFGARTHPVTGQTEKMHYGIDFAVPVGTPVYAADDGVVSASGSDSGTGLFVHIDHAGGRRTAYYHLSQIVAPKGTKVRQGQVIALSGNTGISTGPHLHWEVRRIAASGSDSRTDPLNVIDGTFPLTSSLAKELGRQTISGKKTMLAALTFAALAGGAYFIYRKTRRSR